MLALPLCLPGPLVMLVDSSEAVPASLTCSLVPGPCSQWRCL